MSSQPGSTRPRGSPVQPGHSGAGPELGLQVKFAKLLLVLRQVRCRPAHGRRPRSVDSRMKTQLAFGIHAKSVRGKTEAIKCQGCSPPSLEGPTHNERWRPLLGSAQELLGVAFRPPRACASPVLSSGSVLNSISPCDKRLKASYLCYCSSCCVLMVVKKEE